MIKFDILNRFTNAIQFTAEIDCEEGELNSVKLGLSIKRALENDANLSYANLSDAYLSDANLSGANLRGTNLSDAKLSDANLRGANLSGADLSGAYLSYANLSGANLSYVNLSEANLRGAYLRGAYLRGAYLSDANLSGANLSGTNLSGAYLSDANLSGANLSGAYLIHLGVRSDGYEFFAVVNDGVIWIKAGCRYFSIKDAANHWKETRDGTPLGDESKQFLSHARKLVKIRNLLEVAQ